LESAKIAHKINADLARCLHTRLNNVGATSMSGGAVKGIEVLLIAGGVFWFAYSQMKALKRPTPGAEKPGAEHKGESAGQTADEEPTHDKS
jgi:hypothetical protein